MVEVTIENIDQQYDEEGEEVVAYIVEYTIPQYDNLYRTEPIPADEFDQEYAKELVAKEASPLIVAPEIEVKFPSETSDTGTATSSERAGVSRRWVVAGGVGCGILGLVGGWLVAGQNASPDSTAAISTPSATTAGTPEPTAPQGTQSSPTDDPATTEPASEQSTATPTQQSGSAELLALSFSESFDDGLNGWVVNQRFRTGENESPENPTPGDGGYSDRFDGSVRLHVDGGPSTIGVAHSTTGISEGSKLSTTVYAEADGTQPGNVSLAIFAPDGDDSPDERSMNDGDVTTGEIEIEHIVQEKYAEGAEIRVWADVWPGEFTVYVQHIGGRQAVQ